MRHVRRTAVALRAAVIGVTLLGGGAAQGPADDFWINPVDPAGEGTDPDGPLHLSAVYQNSGHWNSGIVPGAGASVFFAAPGYPVAAYTVSMAEDTQADRVTIGNHVTFNFSGATYT